MLDVHDAHKLVASMQKCLKPQLNEKDLAECCRLLAVLESSGKYSIDSWIRIGGYVTDFPCVDGGRYTGQAAVKYQILKDPLVKRPVEILLGCGDGSYTDQTYRNNQTCQANQSYQLYGAWENGYPTLASLLCEDGRIFSRRFLYGYNADNWLSFLDKYFLPASDSNSSNSSSSSSNNKGTLPAVFHCDSLDADWNWSVPLITESKSKKWGKTTVVVKNERANTIIRCTGTLKRASALTWPHSCSLPFPVRVVGVGSKSSCLPKELEDLVIEYHEDFTLHFSPTIEDSKYSAILSISPGLITTPATAVNASAAS